jgi:hypothetical protein
MTATTSPVPDQVPPPLPLRLRPYAHETLLGFIARLAEINRHDSAQWIASDTGLSVPAAQLGHQDLGRLAGLCGLPAPTLRALVYVEADRGFHRVGRLVAPAQLLGISRRRFCPPCLSALPYHRALWDVLAIGACPDHGCALATTCVCGHTLEWTSPSLTACRCGQDLRARPIRAAPPAVLALSREIALLTGYGVGRSALPRAFRSTPVAALLDLFRVVGEYDPELAVAEVSRRLEAEEYVAAGYQRCRNWPGPFRRFLRDLQASPSRLAAVRWPYRTITDFRRAVPDLAPSAAATAVAREVRRFVAQTEQDTGTQ